LLRHSWAGIHSQGKVDYIRMGGMGGVLNPRTYQGDPLGRGKGETSNQRKFGPDLTKRKGP